MPTKSEILGYIKSIASKQLVTKNELIAAYDEGAHIQLQTQTQTKFQTKPVSAKKYPLTEILYFIGGGIIFLGIAILLAQHWQTLQYSTKILSTLGAGIAAYLIGILLTKEKKTENISSAFYLIFCLVTPIGLSVLLDHSGIDARSFSTQALISGIMFMMQLFSYVIFPRNIFVLFSIIFGTWLFLSLTSFLMNHNLYFHTVKFYEYRVLATGLVYILLGHAFSGTSRAPLSGFLYGFGLIGFLGAALCLGGWKSHHNIWWELAFPVLAFGAVFLGAYLNRKVFLIFGALFLMIFILKISSEYFSNSLGWPLALVIGGLLMIAISYMSLQLRKKYLTE